MYLPSEACVIQVNDGGLRSLGTSGFTGTGGCCTGKAPQQCKKLMLLLPRCSLLCHFSATRKLPLKNQTHNPWNISHKAQCHRKPGADSWFVNLITFLSVMGMFSVMMQVSHRCHPSTKSQLSRGTTWSSRDRKPDRPLYSVTVGVQLITPSKAFMGHDKKSVGMTNRKHGRYHDVTIKNLSSSLRLPLAPETVIVSWLVHHFCRDWNISAKCPEAKP